MKLNWMVVVGAAALAAGMAVQVEGAAQDFNGASSYDPANTRDGPIFRQFAFVENMSTQYHVLSPEAFLTDNHRALIYQFPVCATLAPVFEKHHAQPGDPLQLDHDAPTRQIVDVVLSTGCSVQPKSEAEVLALKVGEVVKRPLFVNAPIIPAQFADFSDTRLFTGPPFRPRVDAWQEGVQVKFITYEVNWIPTWAATNFANGNGDADVFVISYSPTFRPDFTIINVAAGTVNHPSQAKYSPIWRANCIVDADNQQCMTSVSEQAGYTQCFNADDCLKMKNPATQKQVLLRAPNTFTHINCPMVAVNLDPVDLPGTAENDVFHISPWEELVFPNLWVNGPVTVV